MWEQIAMWGGVAGLIVSIFAVIILYLTRKNILDILDKDVILFDRNFELKKSAITEAYSMIDEIMNSEGRVKSTPAFVVHAKNCYNELLCVVSDIKVADEFYSIALEENEFSPTRIAQFKLMCRHDIGLKTKKAQAVKRLNPKHGDSHSLVENAPQQTNVGGGNLGGNLGGNQIAPNQNANLNYSAPQTSATAQTSASAQQTRATVPNQTSASAQPVNSTLSQNSTASTQTSGTYTSQAGSQVASQTEDQSAGKTPYQTAASQTSNKTTNPQVSVTTTQTSGSTGANATPVRRGRPPINRSTAVPTNAQTKRSYPADEGKE